MTIVVAEISIPNTAFELGEILHDHGRTRIELTQFVPTGEGLAPYFWAETADHAPFEESVRDDDRVETLTEVDVGPNTRLYRIEWADPMGINGFLRAIRDHDLIVESAVGTDETWHFRLRAPHHDGLAAFQRTCAESGIQLTVHRVWNPASDGHDRHELTRDQREALEVALRLGYFKTPSEATLGDIGDELDISPQAASKRIRGGVEKLVTTALRSAE